jgi:hypothetical protein
MVNTDYSPDDREEAVLAVMRDEGRVNPYLLRDETGLEKGAVNTALSNLTAAGWVSKVTRGLYEFVEDPREDREAVAVPQQPERRRPIEYAGLGELMDFERELTSEREVVLSEWLEHVQANGRVQKSDFAEWYSDAHEDRTGYGTKSFWEFFAKPAMQQSDGFEQPNSRTYTVVDDE